MGRPEKTEPLPVCVDADVLIAGLLSRTGASHAILVLGEIGLLRLVLPEAAVAEVRRNLVAKLPEAAPLFEEFLRSVPVQIHQATPHDRERAREFADPNALEGAESLVCVPLVLLPHSLTAITDIKRAQV